MDDVKIEAGRDYGQLVKAQKGLVIGLASGVGIAALASLVLGGWVVPVIAGVILGAVIGINVNKGR